MKLLLVLTSEPISARQLRDALGTDTDPAAAEVMVVSPAFAQSALRFWMSDAEEAITKAATVRQEGLQELAERFGVPVAPASGLRARD